MTQTARKIEFHFDFGSPNAYLAYKVLPGIAARQGADLNLIPVLLGGVFRATNNRSPAEAFVGIRNRLEYEAIERDRFIRRHGLTRFAWNPAFPVNTLRLMRGAVAAQQMGVFDAYVAAVFTAMWEDQVNMGDPETAIATVTGAGLDGAAIFAAAETQPVKDALLETTNRAVEMGDFGSPTFHVGGEIFFGKDRLRDLEDHLSSL